MNIEVHEGTLKAAEMSLSTYYARENLWLQVALERDKETRD